MKQARLFNPRAGIAVALLWALIPCGQKAQAQVGLKYVATTKQPAPGVPGLNPQFESFSGMVQMDDKGRLAFGALVDVTQAGNQHQTVSTNWMYDGTYIRLLAKVGDAVTIPGVPGVPGVPGGGQKFIASFVTSPMVCEDGSVVNLVKLGDTATAKETRDGLVQMLTGKASQIVGAGEILPGLTEQLTISSIRAWRGVPDGRLIINITVKDANGGASAKARPAILIWQKGKVEALISDPASSPGGLPAMQPAGDYSSVVAVKPGIYLYLKDVVGQPQNQQYGIYEYTFDGQAHLRPVLRMTDVEPGVTPERTFGGFSHVGISPSGRIAILDGKAGLQSEPTAGPFVSDANFKNVRPLFKLGDAPPGFPDRQLKYFNAAVGLSEPRITDDGWVCFCVNNPFAGRASTQYWLTDVAGKKAWLVGERGGPFPSLPGAKMGPDDTVTQSAFWGMSQAGHALVWEQSNGGTYEALVGADPRRGSRVVLAMGDSLTAPDNKTYLLRGIASRNSGGMIGDGAVNAKGQFALGVSGRSASNATAMSDVQAVVIVDMNQR